MRISFTIIRGGESIRRASLKAKELNRNQNSVLFCIIFRFVLFEFTRERKNKNKEKTKKKQTFKEKETNKQPKNRLIKSGRAKFRA